MKKLSRLLLSTATVIGFASMASAADPELTVFDWAGFENQALIEGYVAKHGQMPTYAFFGDDDEAFQKVASGFKADAVHPCSQMVSKYRDAGLIEPWDTSKLTSLDQLDPTMLESPVFKDDQGLWYLPSYWGATAVAYNIGGGQGAAQRGGGGLGQPVAHAGVLGDAGGVHAGVCRVGVGLARQPGAGR